MLSYARVTFFAILSFSITTHGFTMEADSSDLTSSGNTNGSPKRKAGSSLTSPTPPKNLRPLRTDPSYSKCQETRKERDDSPAVLAYKKTEQINIQELRQSLIEVMEAREQVYSAVTTFLDYENKNQDRSFLPALLTNLQDLIDDERDLALKFDDMTQFKFLFSQNTETLIPLMLLRKSLSTRLNDTQRDTIFSITHDTDKTSFTSAIKRTFNILGIRVHEEPSSGLFPRSSSLSNHEGASKGEISGPLTRSSRVKFEDFMGKNTAPSRPLSTPETLTAVSRQLTQDFADFNLVEEDD